MRFSCYLLLLLTSATLLAAAPTPQGVDDPWHNDPSFRSNICQFLCTKDPPEGGNFCNCDRHPLG